MSAVVYDDQEVRAAVSGYSVCIMVMGHRIYITAKELADIAEAVEQYLSAAEDTTERWAGAG